MNTETLTAPSDTVHDTPGVAAMQNQRWRIAGDTVARVLADQPDDIRRELKWLQGYGLQRQMSYAEAGALLRQPDSGKPYSGDSIYQALTGRRNDSEGSLRNLAESVRELRQRVEETAPRGRAAFIETSLTKRIWGACAAALRRQKLTFIFGPSQIGKSTAIAEYAARHNHGETIMVRMPTRGALGDFLEELAIRIGISPQSKTKELRRRIIESFDDRTLLIVDECHECLRSHYSDRALATLDFIREIYDRRRCGVVLVGTDVFRAGVRSIKILKQLWLRGYRPLQLPAAPTPANLVDFAKAFGLDPAPDRNITVEHEATDDSGRTTQETVRGNPSAIQAKVITTYGLGRWLNILEDAAESAADAGKRNTWGRVILAHHTAQQIEGQ